jgi:hypothetical protein
MPSKSMRLLAAAATIAALAALAAPGTALAKAKHPKPPSAVDVYVEQVQTATGHQPAPSSSSGATTTGSTPSPSVALSPTANRKLATLGGKDAGLLHKVATHPGFAGTLAAGTDVSQPGTLNAAFDVGLGPAVLFAIVLATVLLVAVGGGLRGWRRLRRD